MPLDYKKVNKDLYSPSAKEVSIVDVPAMNFLMIDGQGDPNSKLFQQVVEALYAVAYTIKMMPKKGPLPKGNIEYVVPPLEGLWWIEGGGWDIEHREKWLWTAMIRQPDFVTKESVQQARTHAAKKKSSPLIAKVRFESFREGMSAQIMHIGPFATEGPTIQRIFACMETNGYKPRGKHHEIYLSDPRKAEPGKMKTVLRHPME
jgi:hypothetical protein